MQDEGQLIGLRVREVVPDLLSKGQVLDVFHFLEGLFRKPIRKPHGAGNRNLNARFRRIRRNPDRLFAGPTSRNVQTQLRDAVESRRR